MPGFPHGPGPLYPPVTFAEEESDDAVYLGNPLNYWVYHPDRGFDLTRGSSTGKILETTTGRVTVDPKLTALVIVDMQNFFLHASIRSHPLGLAAEQVLVDRVIPACRRAGIQVIYCNWGLTEHDLQNMPPAIIRGFSRDALPAPGSAGKESRTAKRGVYVGMGQDMGLMEGQQAGKVLMRGSWNADLHEPLKRCYEDSQSSAKPDVIIHKNRLSGMWGTRTPLEAFCDDHNLRTLVFAGVNTDQCVSGTLYDAYAKGFDSMLLSDCSATGSPSHAQQTIEYNVSRGAGFVLSGEKFADAF